MKKSSQVKSRKLVCVFLLFMGHVIQLQAQATAPDFDYIDAGIIAVNHFLEINSESTGISLGGGEQFGTSVANLGDLDGAGAGVTTVAVGGDFYGTISGFNTVTNLGAIYIMNLNADGTLIGNARRISEDTNGINIAENDFFGSSIVNLGDLDIGLTNPTKITNSLVTIAVGAVGEKAGGTFGKGAIHLINLNSTGGIVGDVVKIDDTDSKLTLANFGEFGASIADLGDLDGTGSGVTTLAVGSSIDGTGGSVYLINIDLAGEIEGTPVKIVNGSTGITLGSGDEFGASIANLGDLDGAGDGAVTIAVGVPLDDTGGTSNTGAVYLINLSATLSIVGTPVKITNSTDGITLAENNYFGQSLANIGDLDGEGGGVTTLAVGAFGGEEIYIINLDSAGAIVGTPGVINNAALSATIEDGNQFGSSIANLGDLNGDGIDEIVVGENAEDTGQTSRGEIHIISFAKKQYTLTTADTVDITLPSIETGEPAPTYTITTLPTGLSFDAATRRITGTPTAVTAATDYTLTATIGSDTDTYVFNIEVVQAVAPDFGYADAGIIAVNHFAKLSNSDSALNLGINDIFGRSVANLGDIDGSGAGVTAIAVGAPNDNTGGFFRGAVYIVNLDSDGAILGTPTKLAHSHDELRTHIYNNAYGFGGSVESLGDLDIGLSTTDAATSVVTLAVGATGDDAGSSSSFLNRGAVYLINLDSTGDIVGEVVKLNGQTTGISLRDGDLFGGSVVNLGDLDGSGTGGVTTIAVGATGVDTGGNVANLGTRASLGAIYILNIESDGTLVGDQSYVLNESRLGVTLVNQGSLGSSLENLGDLDIGLSTADAVTSVATIATGAPSGALSGSGAPESVSGYPNDGGSVYLINISASGERVGDIVKIGDDTSGLSVNHGEGFGSSILSLGDIDGTGDGAVTLAIGNTGIDVVKIINFDENGAIVGPVGIINDNKISDTLTRFDVFGASLANIGDIDGDGIDEIAVGETVAEGSRGTLHIISVASIEYGLTTSAAASITLPAVETGSPVPTYVLSPTTLPTGLNFDAAAGTITGTPTTDTAGTDYTLTATNGSGNSTFSFRLGVGELDPTPSSNNDLSDLEISSYTSGAFVSPNWQLPTITSLTLSPAFSSSTVAYTIPVTLAETVQTVIITPTASSSRATLTVNGEDAASGIEASQITLNTGQNAIPIVVTAEDGTQKTYTITVEKAAPLTTWTGTTDSNWTTATNWTDGVPTATHNVLIPKTTNQPTATAVTVNKVTINSGASLIANAAFSGNITYNREIEHTSGNQAGWYLMASPVAGQTYDDAYITANDIAEGTGNNRGIATFNTLVGTWSYHQSGGTAGTFVSGQGYAIKKQTSTGTVAFTGTLNVDDAGVNVMLSNSGNRFNLLGNPYPSYLNSATFLNNDEAAISDTQTLWVWNRTLNTNGGYEVKVAGDAFIIAPGQGFFVKANTGSNPAFNFSQTNQSHSATDTFQKSQKTQIKLDISDGAIENYCKIYYSEETTSGFDVGYDGELFSGTPNPFAIYTHLVSDSQGKNYQIQSLPYSDIENMVIPVGINAASGKEISITADVTNFPAGVHLYLEDKLENSFTQLDKSDAKYTVTLSDNLEGIGRFFLRASSSDLSDFSTSLENISVYTFSKNNLRVVGIQDGNVKLRAYNILGAQIIDTSFKGNGKNDVAIPNLATGIYIIHLEMATGKVSRKVVVE